MVNPIAVIQTGLQAYSLMNPPNTRQPYDWQSELAGSQLTRDLAIARYANTEEFNRFAAEATNVRIGAALGEAGALREAGQKALEASRNNSAYILKEGGYTLSRKDDENKQTISSARARQAASGIVIKGGSPRAFRDELSRVGAAERKQIGDAYAHQSLLARQQGDAALAQLNALAGGAEASAHALALEAANAARQRLFDAEQGIAAANSRPQAAYNPNTGGFIAANPAWWQQNDPDAFEQSQATNALYDDPNYRDPLETNWGE